jgi:transcriptional regulator with GAF, ATPase, and Fis domain
MTARLIALEGPLAGKTFGLERAVTALGRGTDNDVIIDTQWVSRRHCEIRKRDDGYEVFDSGSHNGTMVNGVPIKERVLRHGDRIGLGGESFLFLASEQEPAPALELDEAPFPTRETVELPSAGAKHLHPDRIESPSLASVLSLIETIGSATDETLADRVLDRLFAIVPAERGAIVVGPDPGELEPIAMRSGERSNARFPLSRTVLERVFAQKSGVLSNRASSELATAKSLVASRVTNLVCLPLLTDGRVVGAIYLDRTTRGAMFPESELDLLMGLASIAAGAIERSRQLGRLRVLNRRVREELGLRHEMVGESAKLKEAQRILARAAPTDSTILIEGESGTGKELAARAIHFGSARRDGPFVKVDCTGLNENLLASELFGHERGAFTGAIQQKRGKLELAQGGTVFLDEIGELPLNLQAHLLRVVQDREFERVGGTRSIAVDIRLVAATNRELREEVRKGAFREDLFHRLNVVRLELPPLRERRDDIELLAQYFALQHGRRVKRRIAGISPEALAILKSYDWPGNVRELANVIERAVVLGMTELILPEDLPESMLENRPASGPPQGQYHDALAARKRELVLEAVSRADGNITEAARLLGLHPNYLHRLIRNLGLRDRLR